MGILFLDYCIIGSWMFYNFLILKKWMMMLEMWVIKFVFFFMCKYVWIYWVLIFNDLGGFW